MPTSCWRRPRRSGAGAASGRSATADALPRNRHCRRPMSRSPTRRMRPRRARIARPAEPAGSPRWLPSEPDDRGRGRSAVRSRRSISTMGSRRSRSSRQSPKRDAEPLEDIETYAARRNKRRLRRPSLHWPLSNLQSGILALLIVDAILVGWRSDVVRHVAADRFVLCAAGPAGEPARAGVRQRHHDHRAARGRADPRGRRQRRQRHAQDRRRAAAQIRGPQRRQRGSLFLDRGGAARDRCRPATRWRSAAVSPRRRPTGATCWCVSSPATTSSPEHGEPWRAS